MPAPFRLGAVKVCEGAPRPDAVPGPPRIQAIASFPALAALLAAWSATVGFGSALSWFDEQRIVMLVALAAGAVALVVRREASQAPAAVGAALVIGLGIGLVSTATAARFDAAVAEWAATALFWLSVLHFGGMRFDVRGAAIALAVAPMAAYTTAVAAGYASALTLGIPVGSETLLAGFANPRFPAQLEALTIPLLPLAWYRFRRPAARAALALGAALWWACLIGSGSRTAWLALLCAAMLVALRGEEARRWLGLQASFALIGFATYWIAFIGAPAWFGFESSVETGRFSEAGSVRARLELWRAALALAAEHPLLGAGPMHFAYSKARLGAHPHNLWLQWLAEWGVPATACFAFAIGALWSSVLKPRPAGAPRGGDDLTSTCVAASFAVWSVGVLFDGYMVVPLSQLTSAAVLTLVVARFAAHPAETAPPSRLLGPSTRVLAGLAAAFVAALPCTPLGNPTEREAEWRSKHPGEILWPRFWGQGFIGPGDDPHAVHWRCCANADEQR